MNATGLAGKSAVVIATSAADVLSGCRAGGLGGRFAEPRSSPASDPVAPGSFAGDESRETGYAGDRSRQAKLRAGERQSRSHSDAEVVVSSRRHGSTDDAERPH